MLPPRVRRLLQKIYRTEDLSNPGLASFEIKWQQDRDDAIKVSFYVYLALVLLFACVSTYIFGSPASRITLVTTYLLIGSQMVILGARKLNTLWTNPWYYFLLVQIALFGHAIALRQNIMSDVSVPNKMVAAAIYLGVLVNMIYMTPFLNGMTFVIAIESTILGMTAWGTGYGYAETIAWFSTLFGLSIFVQYVHILNQRRGIYFAALQKKSAEIQASNERLRMEAIEREIIFARKVQQSLAPNFKTLKSKFASLTYFERRHGILSGDWMGARVTDRDELIVAVADVTGKGIGAAMVAQTINTLWSEESAGTAFDPFNWLVKVNRTLRKLGHAEPYTATLGLAIVGELELQYYSCGHVPLYYSFIQGGNRQYGRLLARGNILGFSDDLDLTPVKVEFRRINADLLLIGTDGVFERGGITNTRKIDSLVRAVESNGSRALDAIDVADDKLLVWVKRAS
jgi:hypothetical protein